MHEVHYYLSGLKWFIFGVKDFLGIQKYAMELGKSMEVAWKYHENSMEVAWKYCGNDTKVGIITEEARK